MSEDSGNKSLDIQSIIKVSFRGEIPNDIQHKCLTLCQKYLGGNWIQQNVDTIGVNLLTCGITNQIYVCKILNPGQIVSSEPQEVVLRFYGHKYDLKTCDPNNPRFNDNIIALLVSEYNLGPKLYGLYGSGQILKYYPHQTFSKEHFNNSDLWAKLGKNLAQVHAMTPLIEKNPEWILDHFRCFQTDLTQGLSEVIKSLCEEYECNSLKNCDLNEEFLWIANCLKTSNFPIVFCHNDFRGGNVLITEKGSEIVVCDFDYSCYGYRGLDFGGFFLEYLSSEHSMDFPDETIIKSLITEYIRESELLFGKEYSDNEINSIEYMLKETKVFLLVYSLHLIIFLIKYRDDSTLPFDSKTALLMADNAIKNYIHLKNILIDSHILSQ